ncbi:MAG: hypothetical protein GXP32_09240, partial [Kiritimatiellaeota bacterium]|nr:hypothetical protein [Kiritimatiellota bacterium]
MSDRNDIESPFLTRGGNKKAAVILTAAFFCYFASESLLRQAAAGKMQANGMTIDAVVSKLPEGIRETVQRKLEIAKLQEQLKSVKTPEERIFALIALGNASSDNDLELAYAEILDKYPSNPASEQAYTHFLLAPKDAKRSVSLEQFRNFMSKVSDTDRIRLWTIAYSKMIDNDLPPAEIISFFTPIIENPPPFKDYKALFLEIGELAFQNKKPKLTVRCKT